MFGAFQASKKSAYLWHCIWNTKSISWYAYLIMVATRQEYLCEDGSVFVDLAEEFAETQGLPESYSTGCGGPSYRWTEDGLIEIGGEVPRRTLQPGVAQWKDLIYAAAERYGIPAHFIAGIMSFESGGDPEAGSPAGAMGLMQLMHSTANSMAGKQLSVDEIYEPEVNIDLGCKLLGSLWNKYHGDPIKMAFSYNAGSPKCGAGCVRDYSDKANKMPCIADCDPNQFNLRADCYSKTRVTVDYGGIVAAYANDAILSGQFPMTRNDSPTESSPSSSSSNLAKGVFAVGALFLVGVAVKPLFDPPHTLLEDRHV